MKLIPKPIVDSQIYAHCIGIDPPCLLYQLPALGIISDCMLVGINWRSHQHLAIKVPDVAAIKLSQVKRCVMNDISGATKHLQPFFILDVLIMPPPVSSATRCNTTATSCC
jgi:hypothetical protein